MVLTLAEGIVTLLDTYFKANIAAKLTELDTRYGDLTLPQPRTTGGNNGDGDFYRGEQSLEHISGYPAFFTLSVSSDLDIGPSRLTVDGTHEISTGVIAVDTNTERLRTIVERYMLALVELIIEGKGAGSLSPFQFEGSWAVDYSPAIATDTEFMAQAELRAGFQAVEDK